MSRYFAGIAVFPVGKDRFNVSTSVISSANGSIVDNKSSPWPVQLNSLTETVRSMICSTLNEPSATIESYFISVPPAFPADRYCDVFHAIESAKLHDEGERGNYPLPPLNHGEAYSTTYPKDKTTSLLVLDFSCPDHLHAANLSSTEKNGKRVNVIRRELIVPLEKGSSCHPALEQILKSGEEGNIFPERILLIKPTILFEQAIIVDTDQLVAGIYPDIPVCVATINDIALAAASFAYANSLLRVGHRVGQYLMSQFVSVATVTGAAVPIVRSSSERIPLEFFVTFTNSVDYQKTATVRLLVGSHAQAKDNLERGVAVLDGLTPLPKGEARIRVSLKILHLDGWREAIQIGLQQEDGPEKTFLFPRFFTDLTEYDPKYEVTLKKEPPISNRRWMRNYTVLGKLPEQ